jgi:Lar family restriction alleviation protein
MKNFTDEIKPCPFCGSRNLDVYFYDPFDGYMGDNTLHGVRCKDCYAKIEDRKKADVIEKWNRRAR